MRSKDVGEACEPTCGGTSFGHSPVYGIDLLSGRSAQPGDVAPGGIASSPKRADIRASDRSEPVALELDRPGASHAQRQQMETAPHKFEQFQWG